VVPSAAREGLTALSVGLGLGVLAGLMEQEVTEVVGPKGRHDPERVAVRHGHEPGEVTLGGRRVPVERPRVRSADGARDLELETHRLFAGRDLLERWSSGDMALRWAAAGMFEAERQFRRVVGYEQLTQLALAVGRDIFAHTTPTEEVAALAPA